MSAVIWCGIVAVWVFVLIPTWVRRGDLHWHRGSSGAVRASMTTTHLPRTPGGDVGGRSRWSLMSGLRSGRSLSDETVEVGTVDEQDEPQTDERLAVTSRMRVAAAPASQRLTEAVTTVGSGLKGLRSSLPGGPDRVRPPLRVRRARRLLMLAALAVATLAAAVLLGGPVIVLHVACDIALVLYIRHLRSVAREQRARAQRERRARAARQAWDAASSSDRASRLDGWSAPASQYGYQEHAVTETVGAEQTDLTAYEHEEYDESEYDTAGYDEVEYDARYGVAPAAAGHQESLYDQHAPTEELTVVKAS